MPSIRIKEFGGMNLSTATRNASGDTPQVAHNCLLWDGALRPLAKWQSKQGGLSGRYTLGFDGTNLYTINLERAVHLNDEQYPAGTVIGLNPSIVDSDRSNICYQNSSVNTDAILEVGVSTPIILPQSTFTWTPEFQSLKPVNRLYACTLVRNNSGKLEESPLVLIPGQSATAQYFEGDSCSLLVRIQSANIRENCYLRIYRSMSGLSTGQEMDNKLDTDWYLAAEISAFVSYESGFGREYNFIDSGGVTTKPLDRYLAGRFYAPVNHTYNYLTSTEGGWLVVAESDGDLVVSERFMTHAWPTENYIHIPQTITDMKSHYDTVYIGTNKKPYVMAVGMGDSGVQLNVVPAQEEYPCLPNTMAETPSGVMYASPAGLVSLSQEGMRVLTPSMTNTIYPLYTAQYQDTTNNDVLTDVDFDFSDTTYGTYVRGIYFGFGTVAINGDLFLPLGYTFETGSSLDGERPFARMSTFDYVAPGILSSTFTNNGLAVLDASGGVWEMAFPNMANKDAYRVATKMSYTWKSKKYVLPGITTFGVAKIIHDCGCLHMRIYVDGCCVYDTPVCDSQPFTLPPSVVGVEYEVELEGTANVYDFHLATSMKDLTELNYQEMMRESHAYTA